MTIKEQVQQVLDLIHYDNNGFYCCGDFVNLCTDLHVACRLDQVPHKSKECILESLVKIQHDIWNIGILFVRLDWMTKACITN